MREKNSRLLKRTSPRKERKNKMLVNSIKVKDDTLLELKESLSSEKEKEQRH